MAEHLPLIRILGLLNASRDFLYDLRYARTRDEVWDIACGPRLELAHESVLRAIEALTTTIESNIRRAMETDEPKGGNYTPMAS